MKLSPFQLCQYNPNLSSNFVQQISPSNNTQISHLVPLRPFAENGEKVHKVSKCDPSWGYFDIIKPSHQHFLHQYCAGISKSGSSNDFLWIVCRRMIFVWKVKQHEIWSQHSHLVLGTCVLSINGFEDKVRIFRRLPKREQRLIHLGNTNQHGYCFWLFFVSGRRYVVS